jgi:L-lactate dehydrogenase complex protein LldG
MSEPFFKKLSSALAAGPIRTVRAKKPDLTAGRMFDRNLSTREMYDIFVQRAPVSGSTTHRPASLDELAAKIREVVPQNSSILIDPTLPAAGELSEKLREGYTVIPLTRLDDETLFNAKAAITGVDFAVAETASILLAGSPLQRRLSSLVVEFHFALIWPDQIVPDLIDLPGQIQKNFGKDIPAGLTLISGPSKTSDIELTLVVGVHGPAQMHMVLLPG